MGDTEVDKCNICGKVTNVTRKYYYYDIKCYCCNSKVDPHFEIVKYCERCNPKPPTRISVVINPLVK